MAYTFDGQNRLISVDTAPVAGEMVLYAKEMYAYWKQWILSGAGAGYYDAFRSSGGDFTGDDQTNGSYYFFINNWRFKFYAANHRCVIHGNLRVTTDATEDDTPGGSPFVFPEGYSVHVETEFSKQSTKEIVSTGSGLSSEQNSRLFATAQSAQVTPLPTLEQLADLLFNRINTVANRYITGYVAGTGANAKTVKVTRDGNGDPTAEAIQA